MKPVEGGLTQFHGIDIHRTGGEDAQGGLGVDETTSHLTDRPIAPDGKDRVVFFCSSLPLGDIDLPARGAQRTQDAAD